MDIRYVTVVIICGITIVSMNPQEIFGSPVDFSSRTGKSPNCPHGKCFIDRCKRICSCFPNEGNVTCTKLDEFTRVQMDCPSQNDNCPLGEEFKDPLWGDNFKCMCNKDASQTYECFDLNSKSPADPQELLQITLAGIRVKRD